jgi:hypothetical protein
MATGLFYAVRIRDDPLMFKDQERQPKPLIDEYEAEEFDQRLSYAMEYNFAVKVTVWNDGFTTEITGPVHYVNPITQQLHIEVKSGEFEQITFEDVVGVVVVD